MLKRRDKILRAYLPAVNPVVARRLRERELTFDNAAVNADVAQAPRGYRAAWFEFDNATSALRPVSETSSASTRIEAPADLPTQMGSYVAVEIAADGTEYATWRQPVRAYFRRHADGWKLVGLDRLPKARYPRRRAGKDSAQAMRMPSPRHRGEGIPQRATANPVGCLARSTTWASSVFVNPNSLSYQL
jgi:hypothetical protein